MKKATKSPFFEGQLVKINKRFITKFSDKGINDSHLGRKALVVMEIIDGCYLVDFEKPIDGLTRDDFPGDENKYLNDALVWGNGFICKGTQLAADDTSDINALFSTVGYKRYKEVIRNFNQFERNVEDKKTSLSSHLADIENRKNKIERFERDIANSENELEQAKKQKEEGFKLKQVDVIGQIEKYKKNPLIKDIFVEKVDGVPHLVMKTAPITYSNNGYTARSLANEIKDFEIGSYYISFNFDGRESLRCFNYDTKFLSGDQHVCVDNSGSMCLGEDMRNAIDMLHRDGDYLEIFVMLIAFLKQPATPGPYIHPDVAQFGQPIMIDGKVTQLTYAQARDNGPRTDSPFDRRKYDALHSAWESGTVPVAGEATPTPTPMPASSDEQIHF